MERQSFKADFLIVGCGFAGATFARSVAENGYTSHIIDKRDHIGGNGYMYRDKETQIEIHKYGPHIFHTNSKEIWDFINRFTTFNHYINRVKAVTGRQVYSLPINLHTINQFFHKNFNPAEAEEFIERVRDKNVLVTNFKESLLSSIGRELYEAFFKYYTIKHWGVDPKEINVSTAKRLPVRFDYNDNYYNDAYQGIPMDGYTKIFERMLDHPGIKFF
jgi:UDP-galactopyranose mutase